MLIERVERRCERLLLSEFLHQTGRHRLHKDNHDIGPLSQGRLVDYRPFHHVHAVDLSANAVRGTCKGDGLVVRHEREFLILLPHVVNDRRNQVECRIDAQLVEEGIVAIVSLADLDGVVARTATDAEHTQQDQHDADDRTDRIVCLAHLLALRQGYKTCDIVVLQLFQPPDEDGGDSNVPYDKEPVTLFLKQHTESCRDVTEPAKDARIDVLEEISKIRNVGRRRREGQGKANAAPHGDTTPQTVRASARHGCCHHHHQRHNHNVARYDIVKPQTT